MSHQDPKNWRVVFTNQGRTELVEYIEPAGTVTFELGVGFGDVMFYISGPNADDWECYFTWAAGRQAEIFDRVARAAVKESSSGAQIWMKPQAGRIELIRAGAPLPEPPVDPIVRKPACRVEIVVSRSTRTDRERRYGLDFVLGSAFYTKTIGGDEGSREVTERAALSQAEMEMGRAIVDQLAVRDFTAERPGKGLRIEVTIDRGGALSTYPVFLERCPRSGIAIPAECYEPLRDFILERFPDPEEQAS